VYSIHVTTLLGLSPLFLSKPWKPMAVLWGLRFTTGQRPGSIVAVKGKPYKLQGLF
jgi:hypothetical protein